MVNFENRQAILMNVMNEEFQLMVAPLQGLTEAAWRSVHFGMFGNSQQNVEYFTPFLRVEKGVVRGKDLRDFTSELNRGLVLTPQIIFRDEEEWRILVDTLVEAGAERIDMNLGCPFVPQVRKGRGAGMLRQTERLARIAEIMLPYADSIKFSVKMRLGLDDPGEASGLTDILNNMPLRHVTIHPRTAAQQYKGELLLSEMDAFTSQLKHPVIFNGEISTPSEIRSLTARYSGVMVGRGLLARPSLFSEYRSGEELSPADQVKAFLALVNGTSSLLAQKLCGPAQLRDKMKTYWEYVPYSLDRKIVKQGKKQGIVKEVY